MRVHVLLAGLMAVVAAGTATTCFTTEDVVAQQEVAPRGVEGGAAPDDPASDPRLSPPDVPPPDSEPGGSAPDSPPGDRPVSDPFQYRVPEGSDGFVASADLEIPRGIRVLGILLMRSGQSLAALQLPGDDEVFYVRENDDLQIHGTLGSASPDRLGGGTSPGRRPMPPDTGRGAARGSGMYYLRISKITAQHVEVYPEHNPSHVQLLR